MVNFKNRRNLRAKSKVTWSILTHIGSRKRSRTQKEAMMECRSSKLWWDVRGVLLVAGLGYHLIEHMSTPH